MWPVLCSLKLVINVSKSLPGRPNVHGLKACSGGKDEAGWVISLRQADNSVARPVVFKDVHMRAHSSSSSL